MTSPQLPSERRFGALFVIVFAIAGGWGLYASWDARITGGCFAAAGLFALAALLAPRLLAPLNRAWFRLGELLGRIVSPIVLGVIFFGLITPVALAGRISGRDELKMKRRDVASYWVDRDPPGPEPESFKNQF